MIGAKTATLPLPVSLGSNGWLEVKVKGKIADAFTEGRLKQPSVMCDVHTSSCVVAFKHKSVKEEDDY